MELFPRRRFVLVGDSSERDGELYAGVARKYPGQVAGIHIREAGGKHRNWDALFAGVQGWQVFRDAGEVG
jgi:phosphatidate phosphatase APP1